MPEDAETQLKERLAWLQGLENFVKAQMQQSRYQSAQADTEALNTKSQPTCDRYTRSPSPASWGRSETNQAGKMEGFTSGTSNAAQSTSASSSAGPRIEGQKMDVGLDEFRLLAQTSPLESEHCDSAGSPPSTATLHQARQSPRREGNPDSDTSSWRAILRCDDLPGQGRRVLVKLSQEASPGRGPGLAVECEQTGCTLLETRLRKLRFRENTPPLQIAFNALRADIEWWILEFHDEAHVIHFLWRAMADLQLHCGPPATMPEDAETQLKERLAWLQGLENFVKAQMQQSRYQSAQADTEALNTKSQPTCDRYTRSPSPASWGRSETNQAGKMEGSTSGTSNAAQSTSASSSAGPRIEGQKMDVGLDEFRLLVQTSPLESEHCDSAGSPPSTATLHQARQSPRREGNPDSDTSSWRAILRCDDLPGQGRRVLVKLSQEAAPGRGPGLAVECEQTGCTLLETRLRKLRFRENTPPLQIAFNMLREDIEWWILEFHDEAHVMHFQWRAMADLQERLQLGLKLE